MRISKDCWLINRPIAHRGLWGNEIIENSVTAYKNAVNNGYPIEIDLYLSTDGVLFSFHDSKLKRMTGADGNIFEKSSQEIKALRLSNSEEQIPTFDEVLEICEGKSPILIEIKDQPNKTVVDKVIERLKTYKGEFAIQSFNPLYMKRVKKLAPNFIRGVLSHQHETKRTAFTRFVIKHMPFNFLIKPDFIAVNYQGVKMIKKKAKNKAVLVWTVTSCEIANSVKNDCNNIIFEHFIPQ